MSEHDENRPLTRRELRLREMAAAGVEAEEAARAPGRGEQAATTGPAEVPQIEIPLVDENGRLRSRRELRELRAQAEAALMAASGPASATPETFPPAGEREAEETPEEEPAKRPDEVESSPEAAQPSSETVQPPSETVQPPSEAAQPATSGQQSPFLPPSEVEDEPIDDTAQPVPGFENPQPASEPESEGDADATDAPAAPQADDAELADRADLAGDAPAPESPADTPTQQYSFPDIAPIDEGQPVFDDPALRVMGGNAEKIEPAPTGGFDDLINRAVAQENGSGASTSALILPTMPDQDGLVGPLGETGELYITGSIDLPKSLGETGGHASIHDSVEVEPFDELGFTEPTPTGAVMAPVSASRAVSARASQGPLVAEASKDKSKLPVILISTGGVLVLGAIGLVVWAATSGLFG